MAKKNYRSYIDAVIAEATRHEVQYRNSMAYDELTKWLRKRGERIDPELFKAILSTCRKLQEQYRTEGKASIGETTGLMSMLFHSFTAEDGIHTDESLLREYVEEVFPIIRQRMDAEKSWGSIDYRLRHVDVARLGEFFDDVLSKIDDRESRGAIESMMNDFVLNDLS